MDSEIQKNRFIFIITGTMTSVCTCFITVSTGRQIGESTIPVQFVLAVFFLGMSLGFLVSNKYFNPEKFIPAWINCSVLLAFVFPLGFYFLCYSIVRQIYVLNTCLFSGLLIPVGALFGYYEGLVFKTLTRSNFNEIGWLFLSHGTGILAYIFMNGHILPLRFAFIAGIFFLLTLFFGRSREKVNPYLISIFLIFHLTALYFMPQIQKSIDLIPSSIDLKAIVTVPTSMGLLRQFSRDSTDIVSLNNSPFFWSDLMPIEKETYTHLPVLAIQTIFQCRRILLIGHGSGLLTGEILKYPVDSVDYYDFLSSIKESFKPPFPELFNLPMDNRFKFYPGDPLGLFLKNKEMYDLILLLPVPYEQSYESVFFTWESFFLLKQHLTPEGILACYPYSMLSLPHTMQMNAMLIRSLSGAFSYKRILTPFRPVNNKDNSPESDKYLPLREIILASNNPIVERIYPEDLIDTMNRLHITKSFITSQYIKALFALADISGEITYDKVDFSLIVPSTLDSRQYPWFNYQNDETSVKPINFIQFGVSKKTGKLEARIHLKNNEILIRRNE